MALETLKTTELGLECYALDESAPANGKEPINNQSATYHYEPLRTLFTCVFGAQGRNRSLLKILPNVAYPTINERMRIDTHEYEFCATM